MTIAAVVAGATVAAVTGAGGGSDPPPPAPRASDDTAARTQPAQVANGPSTTKLVRYSVGRGARGAAIVRPAGAAGPQPVVVFMHGWGLTGPDAYGRWIRHLARRGNTVIVPRYQVDAAADPSTVRAAAIAGIRRALRRVRPAPRTLVVAGHSAGAALAADYAATAASERLPVPVAVYAVYPGRRILGYPAGIPEADPASIPANTRLLVLAGARDAVVGELPARQLVSRAASVRHDRRHLLRITGAAADHLAPLRAGRAARRAFWRPLDRLVDRARR